MPQGSVLVFLQNKRRIPHYHNNTSTCTPGQSLSDFPSHSAFICVFSMALYNCTFFSDGNGALSILCLLYHLAQCSAHSRSSITHTHTHHTCAHTHTHTHTRTHTHTHDYICLLPTLSGSEVLWRTELRVTRISRGWKMKEIHKMKLNGESFI